MPRFGGVLGPVVTPFRADESLDIAGFADNIRMHIEAGLDGVLVAGSTGEAVLLDEAERRELISEARAIVPRDRLLLAGTGAESTRQCVARCRDAAAEGADAVLVVAPHYYSSAMTSASLWGHYTRVADESPIPVLVYNIPKYAHFRLDAELIAELAMHPNVSGMKDSSGDMEYFPRYIEAQSDTFDVLTGHGGSFATALRHGARGGILAVALFAAELSLEVWRAHQAGHIADGDEAQRRLVPLAAEIVGRMGVPAVKAAMDHVGMQGGAVRLPLLPLGDHDLAYVKDLLREALVEGVEAGAPPRAGSS